MELKELEEQVDEYDDNIPPEGYEIEDHPTYKLDEHPDGWDRECHCRTCGSYR